MTTSPYKLGFCMALTFGAAFCILVLGIPS